MTSILRIDDASQKPIMFVFTKALKTCQNQQDNIKSTSEIAVEIGIGKLALQSL